MTLAARAWMTLAARKRRTKRTRRTNTRRKRLWRISVLATRRRREMTLAVTLAVTLTSRLEWIHLVVKPRTSTWVAKSRTSTWVAKSRTSTWGKTMLDAETETMIAARFSTHLTSGAIASLSAGRSW